MLKARRSGLLEVRMGLLNVRRGRSRERERERGKVSFRLESLTVEGSIRGLKDQPSAACGDDRFRHTERESEYHYSKQASFDDQGALSVTSNSYDSCATLPLHFLKSIASLAPSYLPKMQLYHFPILQLQWPKPDVPTPTQLRINTLRSASLEYTVQGHVGVHRNLRLTDSAVIDSILAASVKGFASHTLTGQQIRSAKLI